MNKADQIITLAHGSGGTQSHELVSQIFAKWFANPALNAMSDSALITIDRANLAFTTDAYVVKPVKFPGGDIGKLAICGTVNDLAVAGARPKFLTAAFIIEEGTSIALIDEIAQSMALAAREAGVEIVAGDTKVVEKSKCDTLFITTAGVGEIFVKEPISPSRIKPQDVVIINGWVANHGMAIMAARDGLSITTEIKSDCAPLNSLVEILINAVPDTRFMRDVTRGGLATVLNEAVENQKFGIEIDQEKIPLHEGTSALCELLGIDPLYVANEGKLIAIVPSNMADKALSALKSHPLGHESAIIGTATSENAGKVTLKTTVGSKRLVAMLSGNLLPRIC